MTAREPGAGNGAAIARNAFEVAARDQYGDAMVARADDDEQGDRQSYTERRIRDAYFGWTAAMQAMPDGCRIFTDGGFCCNRGINSPRSANLYAALQQIANEDPGGTFGSIAAAALAKVNES